MSESRNASALRLEELRLYQYRNLSNQTVEIGPQVNFFFGHNGRGKTNLLEAIYILAYTKSFRGTKSDQIPAFGSKECSVFGRLQSENDRFEIGVAFHPRSKRVFKSGERLSSLSEYLGTIRSITFTPADMAMLRGSPSLRRKFLDKHCLDLQPQLVIALAEYQRALKNKAALLRSEENIRSEDLDPWNEVLIRSSIQIINARVSLINSLLPVAKEQYAIISSERESFSMALKNSFLAKHGEPSEENLRRYFAEGSKREIAARKTILGLHHDDMFITLSGIDARTFASQGQARSAVLALKIGMLKLLQQQGKEPILLLDDVESELDEGRRGHLFNLVLESPSQVFITGTEKRSEFLQLQGAKNAQIFELLEHGIISNNIS